MAHNCLESLGGADPNGLTIQRIHDRLIVLKGTSAGCWGKKKLRPPLLQTLENLKQALLTATGTNGNPGVLIPGGTTADAVLNADALSVTQYLQQHSTEADHGAPGPVNGWIQFPERMQPDVDAALLLINRVQDCLDAPPGAGNVRRTGGGKGKGGKKGLASKSRSRAGRGRRPRRRR